MPQTVSRELRDKFEAGLRDLDSSIELLQLHLDSGPLPSESRSISHQLATALAFRSLLTWREQDFVRAGELYSLSDPQPTNPVERLQLLVELVDLTVAMFDLQLLAVASAANEIAAWRADLEGALLLAQPTDPEYADALSTLGILALIDLDENSPRSKFDDALVVLRAAATNSSGSVSRRSNRRLEVADALLRGHLLCGFDTDLDHAANIAQEALSELPPSTDHRRARALVIRARIAHTLAERDNDPDFLHFARDRFREAAHEVNGSPWALDGSLYWGWTSLEIGDNHDALAAFDRALELTTQSFQGIESTWAKFRWLERWGRWSSAAAVAAIRSGSPARAIELLETSRGLMCKETQHPVEGFDAESSILQRVFRLTASIPASYLISSPFGGYAINVHNYSLDIVEVEALWIDRLPSGVFTRLTTYMDGYDRARGDLRLVNTWASSLDDLARWAGEQVIKSAFAGFASEETMLVVPVGPAALIPWQAAWWTDAEHPEVRCYLVDRMTLRFPPNLLSIESIADPEPTGSIFAVCDPRPVDLAPLPGASVEVDAIAASFPTLRRRTGIECTRADILNDVACADIVHFACHAISEPWEPLSSYLVMSHGERVTLRDLLADWTTAHLVVLSACETGSSARRLPDEPLSLSQSIVCYGGSPAIGSTWLAPDVATSLIMAKFYELWKQGDLHAATALRYAQLWFRDCDADGLRGYIERLLPDTPAARESFARIDSRRLHHSHPLYWASFTYSG